MPGPALAKTIIGYGYDNSYAEAVSTSSGWLGIDG